MKFDQLILRKIIKIVATMTDFHAKMHKNRFQTLLGELTDP